MESSNAIGLIVAGGKSLRMGIDKSRITYHGITQTEWLKKQMNGLVEKIYVSVSKMNNESEAVLADSPLYFDRGPITSLVSFYDKFPENDVLVIACDYPFFNRDEIIYLLSESKNNSIACWDEAQEFYQPYLAFYTSSFLKIIKENLLTGETSLQNILLKNNIAKYRPQHPDALLNVNTMKEFEYALEKLSNHD